MFAFLVNPQIFAQTTKFKSKKISQDLFGIFFEDINYAADGGLYAELIQNRSFEFSAADNRGWNPMTGWDYITPGFSYGNISIENSAPLHLNNPHYVHLTIEEPFQDGVGIKNKGVDGIPVIAGDSYDFTVFINKHTSPDMKLEVRLHGKKGELIAKEDILPNGDGWKKYAVRLKPNATDDSCSISLISKNKGTIDIDEVSLFPQKTFKNEFNGLRNDLAQSIADLKPKFIRFPGGCLVHGDGLGNMYRWKNTIGKVEERVQQKNIWGYHQSGGLGFYEYFRFCEDIGAKALPVLPAAVSCQNSGGTWKIGGVGQKAIPTAEMKEYIQEVLDLIEWANGPVTSKWGAKRAEAGHPAPFHLEYIGIGNEDRQTDAFRERFQMIYDELHKLHPEIKIIGTVGPFSSGEDYELGWKFADKMQLGMVDEHYYDKPTWFISNNKRYDAYDRKKSKVYIGEYASQGNILFNALSEAGYMTGLERNGDIVQLASYAPLLAKKGFTQWNPDLIYFDRNKIYPTANYYVQHLFSNNSGDEYIYDVVSGTNDSTITASCVRDSKTGDIIVKIVNIEKERKSVVLNKKIFKSLSRNAKKYLLTGNPNSKNSYESPNTIVTQESTIDLGKNSTIEIPASSLIVLRIGR